MQQWSCFLILTHFLRKMAMIMIINWLLLICKYKNWFYLLEVKFLLFLVFQKFTGSFIIPIFGFVDKKEKSSMFILRRYWLFSLCKYFHEEITCLNNIRQNIKPIKVRQQREEYVQNEAKIFLDLILNFCTLTISHDILLNLNAI